VAGFPALRLASSDRDSRARHFREVVASRISSERYSWKGGWDSNPAYGSRLNSVVTWTLTPVDGGTHVRMGARGLRLPRRRLAYDAMNPGWGRVLDSIGRVTSET